MNQTREIRASRGIQEADVWAAADVLLHEGLRPTIERVRQKIGRGSPNTVSPMLERWFASLGTRLAGGVSPSTNLAAGNDADGVPVSVRNATRLLWETARREAEEVMAKEMDAVRDTLQQSQDVLRNEQAELQQRRDAFHQARVSLDAALASSQQARETLERQMASQAIEASAQRHAMQEEIGRLNGLLQEALAGKETLRQEHAAAMAEKDQDLRNAEERHAAQERRLLAEVDRARQSAKQVEASLAREQQQRRQSEEAAAQTLDVGRRKLREAQEAARQMERELRDQIGEQATLQAKTQSEFSALQQRTEELQRQLGTEKMAHEQTRSLLAASFAETRKPSARRAPSKRVKS